MLGGLELWRERQPPQADVLDFGHQGVGAGFGIGDLLPERVVADRSQKPDLGRAIRKPQDRDEFLLRVSTNRDEIRDAFGLTSSPFLDPSGMLGF